MSVNNNFNFVLGDAVSVEQLKTLTLEDLNEIFGGNKRILTKSLDLFGKEVYTVTNNDKNVMSFTTKKQLMDFLKD